MRDLKIMTGIVYFCVAGVAVSLGGGIYTAYRTHQEKTAPRGVNALPTPAADSQPGASAPVAPPAGGALPTPAH